MDRRAFLALLAVSPAFAAVLQACGDGAGNEIGETDDGSGGPEGSAATDGGPQRTTGAELVRSELERVDADPALALEGASVVNQFGQDLFRWLAVAQPEGNLVISPTSIAFALAMASSGANGTTLREMLTVLQSPDPAALHRSANALSDQLDDRSTDVVTLSIANSVWGQQGFRFEQPFLDVLALEYGAGLHAVDYDGDNEGARLAINAWVGEQTAGRITELIGPDVLAPDTRLTLVNAIHLKAPWLVPFYEGATVDSPFTTTEGQVIDHPSMTYTQFMPYAVGDGWTAIELAFAHEELAMVVLLPEDGYIDDYQQNFVISESVDYFETREVTLRLPRFDIRAALSLRPPLESMGMRLPFTDQADFSGVTADERLFISAVIHQANITVDEQGAEAAAATAIVERPVSASIEPPIEVTVDRPFLFAVRDRPTGAILFLGRVGDPRA